MPEGAERRFDQEARTMTNESAVRERALAFSTIDGRYLSITSYRSDGSGVATPVWFVRDGDRLLVETDALSYKVKRIRRRPSVSIAPCTARGKLTGPKVPAHAEILDVRPAGFQDLFTQKYRVDLMFFRPLRALQRALHIGPLQNNPIVLVITPE
jgi:PPOX class probable F420-dependent enzyme